MASRTTVTLVDDVDGKAATETVTFGLDGKVYELDLGEKNATKLRSALAPYIDAGRKVRSSRQSPKAVVVNVDTAAVRAWAASNGVSVSPRGRLPQDVIDQYRAAGN